MQSAVTFLGAAVIAVPIFNRLKLGASQVSLVAGVSMALTAPLVILHSQFFSSRNCPRVYDDARDQAEPAVIIAGFGRFGQITARILTVNGRLSKR